MRSELPGHMGGIVHHSLCDFPARLGQLLRKVLLKVFVAAVLIQSSTDPPDVSTLEPIHRSTLHLLSRQGSPFISGTYQGALCDREKPQLTLVLLRGQFGHFSKLLNAASYRTGIFKNGGNPCPRRLVNIADMFIMHGNKLKYLFVDGEVASAFRLAEFAHLIRECSVHNPWLFLLPSIKWAGSRHGALPCDDLVP